MLFHLYANHAAQCFYFLLCFVFYPNVACFQAVICHVFPCLIRFRFPLFFAQWFTSIVEMLMSHLFQDCARKSWTHVSQPDYMPRRVWPSGRSLYLEIFPKPRVAGRDLITLQTTFKNQSAGYQIFAHTPGLASVCAASNTQRSSLAANQKQRAVWIYPEWEPNTLLASKISSLYPAA